MYYVNTENTLLLNIICILLFTTIKTELKFNNIGV